MVAQLVYACIVGAAGYLPTFIGDDEVAVGYTSALGQQCHIGELIGYGGGGHVELVNLDAFEDVETELALRREILEADIGSRRQVIAHLVEARGIGLATDVLAFEGDGEAAPRGALAVLEECYKRGLRQGHVALVDVLVLLHGELERLAGDGVDDREHRADEYLLADEEQAVVVGNSLDGAFHLAKLKLESAVGDTGAKIDKADAYRLELLTRIVDHNAFRLATDRLLESPSGHKNLQLSQVVDTIIVVFVAGAGKDIFDDFAQFGVSGNAGAKGALVALDLAQHETSQKVVGFAVANPSAFGVLPYRTIVRLLIYG